MKMCAWHLKKGYFQLGTSVRIYGDRKQHQDDPVLRTLDRSESHKRATNKRATNESGQPWKAQIKNLCVFDNHFWTLTNFKALSSILSARFSSLLIGMDYFEVYWSITWGLSHQTPTELGGHRIFTYQWGVFDSVWLESRFLLCTRVLIFRINHVTQPEKI